ncbi:MAG: hypothetical protein HP002_11225 [Lentisphaeria bacterium]|nr:hypothetical protein [Lentisphaeria bacterium]MBS5529189.1 hypothetical protein [bacterium]
MAVYYGQWLKKLALSGEKHLLFARIEFKFENGIFPAGNSIFSLKKQNSPISGGFSENRDKFQSWSS